MIYSAICGRCPDKHFIVPGTEDAAVPLHEATPRDDDHVAVSLDLRSKKAQRRMLARAMHLITERVPSAVTVNLQTSDQDPYGFVLVGVADGAGNELLPHWSNYAHPLADLADEVADEINDLDWDGVVGESEGGFVTLRLSDFAN